MRRLGQGAVLAILPGNIIYEFPVIAGFGLEPLTSDMFRYRFLANYFQNIITHTGSLIFLSSSASRKRNYTATILTEISLQIRNTT